MAASINFSLSPQVLEWARNSMGYTLDEAAQKAGVPLDRYKAWETGMKLPTYRQLENLAQNVYKRPLAILLLAQPPQEESIEQEFRSLSNAQITELGPEVRVALRRAKRYQLILEEVTPEDRDIAFTRFNLSKNDNPVDAAARFRVFLDLSLQKQQSWKPEETHRNFQQQLESIGMYIFKLKMPMLQVRAFCLTGKFPILVLNTEDSENGRVFSLFHETCHVLLNQNDLFQDHSVVLSNKEYAQIEDFCNRFAASFLVPDAAFASDIEQKSLQKDKISDNDIQRLARKYNVSNEVIARKLLFMRLISEDFFWSRKRIWDAAAKSAKEKRNEALKDNDSGIDQGIRILYEKGKPYVSSVINAYHQGLISSSDLSSYLETKLKNIPKINERLLM